MTITHHATMFRANLVRTFALPFDLQSRDIQDIYTSRLGIDDARELVRKAYNRPVDAIEQYLVVRTDFITLEAQNALLKVLEEPPESTKFIFVVPQGFIVLPTLASRFNEVSADEKPTSYLDNEVFSSFLKEGYKERLANIEQAMKKKDVEWQQLIKQGLVQYIGDPTKTNDSLRELEYSARLLLTRGASNKMLFEHIALILPIRLE